MLTFTNALLGEVTLRITVTVHFLSAALVFRYPSAKRYETPKLELLAVGSLGPHQPKRREIVTALLA